MVVRPEVLRERIAYLRETVARLRTLASRDFGDPVIEWAAERGLQLAAEVLGFRNLLVHEYGRIDVARIRDLLHGRLDDFEAFGRAVEAWLALGHHAR